MAKRCSSMYYRLPEEVRETIEWHSEAKISKALLAYDEAVAHAEDTIRQLSHQKQSLQVEVWQKNSLLKQYGRSGDTL